MVRKLSSFLRPMLALPGLMRVLGQSLGAAWILGEQEVSVVMEVADDGHAQALLLQSFYDVGDGLGGIVIVDGDADDFAAGACQGSDLLYGFRDIGSVGNSSWTAP